MYPPSLEKTSKSLEGTDFNDRTLEYSMSLGSQMSAMSLGQGGGKFNSPAAQHFEDRPLTGTGTYDPERQIAASGYYDLSQTGEDDFEFEVDYSEIVKAQEDQENLNQVMNNYKSVLDGKFENVSDDSSSPKKTENAQKQAEARNLVMGSKLNQIKQVMGERLFQ